jgi:hypothetical protein
LDQLPGENKENEETKIIKTPALILLALVVVELIALLRVFHILTP